MKNDLYLLKTASNLHVGSGDINFSIIDNQVQRDPVTELPAIYSSSLKGAFREASKNSQYTEYIFGPDNSSNNNHTTGAFHFFEASILAMPVRSNKRAYFLTTTPELINNFLQNINDFNIQINEDIKNSLENLSKLEVAEGEPLIFEDIQGAILEDFEAKYKNQDVAKIEEFLGEKIALMNHNDFKSISLPVLARNHLENGESKNLWYEEIVPKKSIFYFVIAKPTNLDEADKREKLDDFEKRFDNQSTIQIGANKSIGYGYCKLQKVSKWVKRE